MGLAGSDVVREGDGSGGGEEGTPDFALQFEGEKRELMELPGG